MIERDVKNELERNGNRVCNRINRELPISVTLFPVFSVLSFPPFYCHSPTSISLSVCWKVATKQIPYKKQAVISSSTLIYPRQVCYKLLFGTTLLLLVLRMFWNGIHGMLWYSPCCGMIAMMMRMMVKYISPVFVFPCCVSERKGGTGWRVVEGRAMQYLFQEYHKIITNISVPAAVVTFQYPPSSVNSLSSCFLLVPCGIKMRSLHFKHKIIPSPPLLRIQILTLLSPGTSYNSFNNFIISSLLLLLFRYYLKIKCILNNLMYLNKFNLNFNNSGLLKSDLQI